MKISLQTVLPFKPFQRKLLPFKRKCAGFFFLVFFPLKFSFILTQAFNAPNTGSFNKGLCIRLLWFGPLC